MNGIARPGNNKQVEKEKRMSQTTKQRILTAATQIFSDHGFNGARMDRIAAEAGVNKASIYYHIGPKQALYAAVLHTVMRNSAARLKKRISADLPPEKKLALYIRNFIQVVEDNPLIPPIVLRELASGGKDFPSIVIEEFMKTISLLEGILSEGADRGVFNSMNPLLLHLMIVGPAALYNRVRRAASNRPDIPPDVLSSGILAERLDEVLVPRILAIVRKSATPAQDRNRP